MIIIIIIIIIYLYFEKKKIYKLCTRGYRKRLLEPDMSCSVYFYIPLLSFLIAEQIK